MATISVKNKTGGDAGSVDLRDDLFAVEPNESAVRQAVLAYEANQRAGTHSTKTRAFVRGGGKKPWKQKGTGRARQGSIRAPQWRGGAIIFGPQPRKYTQKLNKQTKRLALSSALTQLVQDNRVIVLDELGLSAPKTKDFLQILKSLNVSDSRGVLVLTAESDENVIRSARNVSTVEVIPVNNINIYSLLTCEHVITTTASLRKLEEVMAI
jgi:large subunit ribosomal protein L4